MTKIAALLVAALPAVMSALVPEAVLTVSPTNIVVSEKAEATVSILLPKRFSANPSLSAGFIPEGSRLPIERRQVEVEGEIAWRFVVKIPVAGEEAGVRKLGPVTVQVPVRTDFFCDFESMDQSLILSHIV
jgi:hypothetical protein